MVSMADTSGTPLQPQASAKGRGLSVKSNCVCMAERATGLKSAPSWKCLFATAESICRSVLLTLI